MSYPDDVSGFILEENLCSGLQKGHLHITPVVWKKHKASFHYKTWWLYDHKSSENGILD